MARTVLKNIYLFLMALNTDKNVKLYYSIKEVAEMFDVRESTRQYTEADIEQIRAIYNLVKVRGFKISAARKMLNHNRAGVDKSSEILETLISVRDELKELKRQLDSLV